MTTKMKESDLNPSTITLATFHNLLKCYPATREAVHNQKARNKKVPKSKKKEPQDANQLGVSEEKVRLEAEAFGELDEWRYTTLPDAVRERGYLDKEEMVRLMEWKLKHGVFRPALMGMIRSNAESLIRKSTTTAFASLPTTITTDDVKHSLETLTKPLRGVGIATASLILSIQSDHIPFYSDDVYLWLCLGMYPGLAGEEKKKVAKMIRANGELSVKYNLQEYQGLYEAVEGLRKRLTLKGDDDGEMVSCSDVDKVAFVLRHIDVSGYFGNDNEGKKRKHDGDGDTGAKLRKRQ